jgi:hypothetical protein
MKIRGGMVGRDAVVGLGGVDTWCHIGQQVCAVVAGAQVVQSVAGDVPLLAGRRRGCGDDRGK